MKKFEILSVSYCRGKDVYQVRGDFSGLTEAEIVDLVFPCNWGGTAVPYVDGTYIVEVYTD